MNSTLQDTPWATNGQLRPRLFDRDQVTRAVELIAEPGGIVELRLLNAAMNGDRWPATYSGYFDEPCELATALQDVTSASGCYLTINPIDPALLARACNRLAKAAKGGTTADPNVTGRRWMLIDIDPQRPAGISATDCERQLALDLSQAVDLFLHDRGWPDPVTADSGNGYHLMYRVDLPADDDGLIKRCLKTLAAAFDNESVKVDTSVHNPARISKLYGTLACKGDSTTDRPHRMSHIMECPEPLALVPHELLEELAGAADPPLALHTQASTGDKLDVESFIQRNSLDVGEPHLSAGNKTFEFKTSPICDHHGDGPWLTQFENGALSAGCHHNSCSWNWHDLRAKLEPRKHLIFCNEPKAFGRVLPSVERVTLAELRAKYHRLHDPVVDGLFRAGETVNIIAAPKMGKSWLGYGLGISVAMGEPWLGRFATAKGRVLLVDNELHRPTLAQRIPKVGEALGFFSADYQDRFDICSLRGNLRSLADLATSFGEFERGFYKMILLDAKYRFAVAGVSENDNASETLVYNTLDQLAEITGAAFVLIHHASKGDQSGKSITDVGAGAGAQSRAADCHLILREHEQEGVFVLDAAVRSFQPVASLALSWKFPLWVPDESVDPSKLKGKLNRSDERQKVRDKEATRKIVMALKDGPATASKLRDRTGLSRDRANRVLNLLVEDDQIEAAEIKIKGNKCLEYRLADSARRDVVD